MRATPNSVLIPTMISKNHKIKLKLTNSQKLNFIRYSLKFLYKLIRKIWIF